MGGHKFQMGGSGTCGPPLATALMLGILRFGSKCRKLIGQNKVTFCKLERQNFKFLDHKLVALLIVHIAYCSTYIYGFTLNVYT